jgi:hypothetical protein
MLRHSITQFMLVLAVTAAAAGPAHAQDPRAEQLAASPDFASTVAGFSDIEYLGYLRYIISLAIDQGSLVTTLVALREQGVPPEHTCFVTRLVLHEDLAINTARAGNPFTQYVLATAGC